MNDARTSTPSVFYKYFCVEHWFEDFISGRSLKFSSRASFNDPYDTRPAYQANMANTELAANHFQSMKATPAQKLLMRQRMRNYGKTIHETVSPGMEKLLDDFGIYCVTSTWENHLMWSHYAGHHRGICVGFHSHMDVFSVALKVNYQIDRPIIRRPQDSENAILEKGLLTKAHCWKYEEEWRIVKRNLPPNEREADFYQPHSLTQDQLRVVLDQRGPNIYSFDNKSIESITVGMRTSQDDIDLIIRLNKHYGLRLSIYQISPIAGSFALKRTRIAR